MTDPDLLQLIEILLKELRTRLTASKPPEAIQPQEAMTFTQPLSLEEGDRVYYDYSDEYPPRLVIVTGKPFVRIKEGRKKVEIPLDKIKGKHHNPPS